MSELAGCAPLRWPAEWKDAALLALLEGTPLNAILAGPETAPAVLDRAKASGIAVVTPEDARIRLLEGVWPGVPVKGGGGSSAEAGPTGLPWVDSNGWLIQLARTRTPDRPVWIGVEPPAGSGILRTPAYELAVADAETYGARWVVALDGKLRAALAERAEPAVAAWKAIAAALRFFDARRDWNALGPEAVLAVISDFSGEHEFLANEILNLLARRSVPYRIVEKGRALDANLSGMKAVVYPDQAPPGDALREKLLAFAAGGGLLVANSSFPAEGPTVGSDVHRRWKILATGKGRIALPQQGMDDPYLVAVDTQLLLSHRNDVVRLFNTGTLNCFYSGDGRRSVFQVVNYATRVSGHPVTVAFKRGYRAARIRTLEAPAPASVGPLPTLEGGVEIHLPEFRLYAGIELEG
jgi:hypothetical protein